MWCWYLLAGGGGAAEGSVFPDWCKVGLDTAFWKTPEALTLLNPGGCLDVSVCNFYQSLMVIVFYLSFSVYVFFPPFLYFLFLFIYIYSRLFFPLFFFSLILDLLSSISSHSPLVFPPSLSLEPGGFQFLGHCSSSLFSQHGRWILPLWQREKKLKAPAKVTSIAFSLFRGF